MGAVPADVLPIASTLGDIFRVLWILFLISIPFLLWDEHQEKKGAQKARTRDIESRGPPAARIGPLVLYEDPPRLYGPVDHDTGPMQEWAVSSDTSATVESAGNVTVTRGRNLAAKAVGGALIPGGVFVFGNARETAHDHRELYLVVTDPAWAYTRRLHPDLGVQARRFAQALNLAARHLGPTPQSASPFTAADRQDAIEKIERLAKLRDSGALTSEEFETQKRGVLRDG